MSDSVPLVSVIIPSFNSARTITETIESVLSQTLKNLEVIIVDDGSSDDTANIVGQIKDRRLNYVCQKHQERSAARNNGLVFAKGRYFAFLDADDLWLPEKLEKQIKLFELDPGIGLVYSDLFHFDDASGNDLYIFGDRTNLYRGDVWLHLLLEDNFIQSPTPIVRREVLDEVGLFDPELPPVEDWDLWLRIAKRYKMDYVDEPLARYRIHQGTTSWSKPSRSLYESTLKLYDKVERSLSSEHRELKKRVGKLRGLMDYRYGRALLRERKFQKAYNYLWAGFRSNPTYPLIYALRRLNLVH